MILYVIPDPDPYPDPDPDQVILYVIRLASRFDNYVSFLL